MSDSEIPSNPSTSNTDINAQGQCPCGETQFKIVGKPIIRAICHCTICQEFNQGPYGDIVIFRNKDIQLPKDNTVAFKAYAFPPVVQRGKCTACNQPAIEFIPGLTIVPSHTLKDSDVLPEVSFHSFYHRRVEDAQDPLPKYSGYLTSQVCFMGKLMAALLRA
ncbi:MAG: hypothetical protein COB04_13620 [Gammaproteobacteria bacterium]|nr:MAG: hypothetical protein COB04_13620 [Gammaproteobacteria bacterium]